ncbi:MAG: NAD-dependent epimerase/dehydratase family protein [Chloroflexi bacterium]|nr:NAD-dependent epimerase/dehydratase family protein [Chloroflexota bacterium]
MAKRILIIGGTRNMGYYLSERLAQEGGDLTLLNRGITKEDLPRSIHRLTVDRTDHRQMRRALLAKSFDVVVDFVLYRRDEARTVIELFRDNVEHYIVLSSGQVYLVRDGLQRPFRETDYEGDLIPAPAETSYHFEEWRYGVEKRDVEDEMSAEGSRSGFPFTLLRLPMVNSARDPYNRLFNYYLRLRDGGPILVPETPNYALNHVYAMDVIDIIMQLINTGNGKGKAYNIAQDEHVSHEEFLNILANIMGTEPKWLNVDRNALVSQGFLPDCAPFSERWMSALDNSLGKAELGIGYTPFADYLAEIVEYFDANVMTPPLAYRRRRAERQFAKNLETGSGA